MEYKSVDGGSERRALRVMFEIAAAALGGASKFAAPNLRLGSSRSDPSVAPGTEHAGSDGGGGGLGEVDVFSSWSWSIDLFSLDLLAFAKNLLIWGPMIMARFLVRREALSHLVVTA